MDADVHDPVLEDESVVGFLAVATGTPPEQVEEELTEGARRRAFVIDELIDAGLSGTELLDTAVRLTGLDESQVKALLRDHLH